MKHQLILCFVALACFAVIADAQTMGTVCGQSNRMRGCDDYGCGSYRSPRGSRIHGGVDFLCAHRSEVYAPFTGTVVRRVQPPRVQYACRSSGLLLRGTGQWRGYEAKIWYLRYNHAALVGKRVAKGQVLGRQQTPDCWSTNRMPDHIHLELTYHGGRIDPTSKFNWST